MEEALVPNDHKGRTNTNRQKLQADRFALHASEDVELPELCS